MKSNLILPKKEIVRPGIDVPSLIKVTGHVKATLFKNGDFKKPIIVFDGKNGILAACRNYLIGTVDGTNTDAMDNLFSSTVATNGGDGIAISDGSIWYSLKCTGTPANSDYTLGWTGSGSSRKLTGEFTGYAITIISGTDVVMGHNWSLVSQAFNSPWATPSAWTSLTIDSVSDYLYIEWTITLS